MGLDTVELVMSIEEEFSLEIPDADLTQLATAGDIHGYLLQALRQRGETPAEAEVWERLKAIIVDQLGVRPEDVIPSARIVEDLGAD